MARATRIDVEAIAARLIRAHDTASLIPPISAEVPEFDVAAGWDVLHEIEARRLEAGWRPVGRKIGFTNRTIWPRYGVDRPMWAHTWSHTVQFAVDGKAKRALAPYAQPRLEPEIVFRLKAEPPVSDDPLAMLAAVDAIAPGFEIVQCPYPGWNFTIADCTAAYGLHGCLVIGTAVAVTDDNRAALARALPTFAVTLRRGGEVIDRGVGANVLGGPADALSHLVRVLATQPRFPPLRAGEWITTGTLTDAAPIVAGETWTSDYGALPVDGLSFTLV